MNIYCPLIFIIYSSGLAAGFTNQDNNAPRSKCPIPYQIVDGEAVPEDRSPEQVQKHFAQRYGHLEPIESDGALSHMFDLGNGLLLKRLIQEEWMSDAGFSTHDEVTISARLNSLPGFVKTKDAFSLPPSRLFAFCSDSSNNSACDILKKDDGCSAQFLVLRRVSGVSLYRYLQNNENITPHFVIGILIQAVALMDIAAERVNFFHFDGHSKNLMVSRTNHAAKWTMHVSNGERVTLPLQFTDFLNVTIVDYGLSAIYDPKTHILIGPECRRMDRKNAMTWNLRFLFLQFFSDISCETISHWKRSRVLYKNELNTLAQMWKTLFGKATYTRGWMWLVEVLRRVFQPNVPHVAMGLCRPPGKSETYWVAYKFKRVFDFMARTSCTSVSFREILLPFIHQ